MSRLTSLRLCKTRCESVRTDQFDQVALWSFEEVLVWGRRRKSTDHFATSDDLGLLDHVQRRQ